ncbi:MAG: heavy-metal-associated domain-containing protein [Bacteroidetes bacterium]|nr:heavy-metal-associated domain-containing protein [Bacteroidota bacterium]MBS1939491.1 heavy-metal-associated domain-containing protein [Bacteroidota bacterium]
MKTTLRTLAFLLLAATVGSAWAQDDHGKFASVDIHTNAVCNDCKHRIETEMLYAKGVQSVTVDLDKEIIHVDYKAKKTDPAKLREAVSKIGYLADDVQPDPAARKALPSCCQMTKKEHDATTPVTPSEPPSPAEPQH